MENIRHLNYYQIIARDWRKLIVCALVVVLLALTVTFLQPFLYSSTVGILVLQKSSFSIDAYSASKSEERIANKLAQVVYSSSFLDKMLGAGFNIDRQYFPSDEFKKRQKWANTIETNVPLGLSRLDITLYHSDPNQSLKMAQAVAYVLTAEKREYIGVEDVDLKVLDAPLVSKYPVKPNIALNLLLGIIAGIGIGIIFVIAAYNPERDKLFAIAHKNFHPTVIHYNQIPEDESVEEDMDKTPSIPEIEEIDEIEKLDDDKSVDKNEIENKMEPIAGNKKEKKDYPKFEGEDEIVGMP